MEIKRHLAIIHVDVDGQAKGIIMEESYKHAAQVGF